MPFLARHHAHDTGPAVPPTAVPASGPPRAAPAGALTPSRTEPASLADRLAGIEGFDATLALRHAAGQPQLLARVLRLFVATYRQGLPALLDACGSEHEVVLRWRTTCHSARGALALIGAAELVDEITAFEDALRRLAPPASLVAAGRRLHEGIAALAARLSARLEATSPERSAPAD